jgi:hypothetical protein
MRWWRCGRRSRMRRRRCGRRGRRRGMRRRWCRRSRGYGGRGRCWPGRGCCGRSRRRRAGRCRSCLRGLFGRLLGFSIGTKFFLGLRHNHRRGLRVRWRASKLHRRQSGGGKQQQTKFCHDGLDPRKKGLATRVWQQDCHQALAINEQALGRIVAGFIGGFVFISEDAKPGAPLFITHSGGYLKPCFHIVPCGISAWSGPGSGAAPGMPASYISVAGEGVVGPCGPRTGNSSGVRPGNSSGLGGSPGSCIGGGTSGRGFPGGLSCGGSAGRPGLIGGSSCGSIGISRFPEFDVPDSTAPMRQCSAARTPKRAPAGCCCGSCRSRCSRARACLRCNRPAIRCATDVRLPPRGATAMAALP